MYRSVIVSVLAWLIKSDEFALCVYEFDWSGEINGRPVAGGGRGTTAIARMGDKWQVVHEHLSQGRLRHVQG